MSSACLCLQGGLYFESSTDTHQLKFVLGVWFEGSTGVCLLLLARVQSQEATASTPLPSFRRLTQDFLQGVNDGVPRWLPTLLNGWHPWLQAVTDELTALRRHAADFEDSRGAAEALAASSAHQVGRCSRLTSSWRQVCRLISAGTE